MKLYLVNKKDIILATQGSFGTSCNHDYYLGYNNDGWYCQFDLYCLAIYDTSLDTDKFFTNKVIPVSKYKAKYSDGKLMDKMGKYDIPVYNIEYKSELNGNVIFSNIKICK